MPSDAMWEYNAKIHLKEIRWNRLDWMKLAQEMTWCCEHGGEIRFP